MENIYKQLCQKYSEALKPLWSIYTRAPDDCYDTIDGPVRIFMDSYELCEDIHYLEQDDQIPEECKNAVQKFIELRKKLDKLERSRCCNSFFFFSLTKDEKEEKWKQHLEKKIEVLKELLAATPSFVSAMYAYKEKTAPASL